MSTKRATRIGFWIFIIGIWAMLFSALYVVVKHAFPTDGPIARTGNPILSDLLAKLGDTKLMRFEFQPYTGFHHPANVDVEDKFRAQPYHFRTNNYGFLTPYQMYPFNAGASAKGRFTKAPTDRVVLLSGGSAAYGWGAGSNETTISYVLASYLNQQDPMHKWHVVNLAMGGWIAYQEHIALDLYGSEFDADWIVLFDGRNDIFVPTIGGERVPNFFLSTGERRLNEVFQEEATLSPWQRLSIFRYRRLSERLKRVSKPLPPVEDWEEAEKAVRFYLHTLTRISSEFRARKILYVTQPLAGYPGLLRRAYDLMISGLQALVRDLPNASYVDATRMFPKSHPGDGNFIDDCHLSDAGQAQIARAMANVILAQETNAHATAH